jgi:DNA topoisomerase I
MSLSNLPANAADAAQMAHAAGLVYVSDASRGIRRVRKGAGFGYRGHDGRSVTDDATLQRIRGLAIPPAYEDVWICSNPRGHLQATGRDARGRKQYRYHPLWRRVRDGAKFERMEAFGAALPRLRRCLRRDLAGTGVTRERVLAAIVSLLDTTRIRVGNDEYARKNGSYGLTTLRNRHVRFVRDGRLRFCFRGKGGLEHEVVVDDKRLASIVRHCHELPGQRLFQYLDDSGERHPVDSGQVNEYLRQAMGADFTAKDFRTWGATLLAVDLLAKLPRPDPDSERAAKACIVDLVKEVAFELRNTPAVCRNSYINPTVFGAWRSGKIEAAAAAIPRGRAPRAERLCLMSLRTQRPAGSRSTSANARRRSSRIASAISSRRATFGDRSAAEE